MTDGIRLLALNDRNQKVDVTETFEPADDGFTGETMETQKPMSALGMAVAAMCRPGGNTPEAQARVVEAMMAPRPTPAEEKAQAIRLAQQAVDRAEEKLRLADREAMEAQLALRELDGRENEPHTRYLRAWLAGDFAAARAARIEMAAQSFLRYGQAPAPDIADEVTNEVARIRNEQDKH